MRETPTENAGAPCRRGPLNSSTLALRRQLRADTSDELLCRLAHEGNAEQGAVETDKDLHPRGSGKPIALVTLGEAPGVAMAFWIVFRKASKGDAW